MEKVKTCATCCHCQQKKRTRKFSRTAIDEKVSAHYCGLSGVQVPSALKGCAYWNQLVVMTMPEQEPPWEQASL